jgi:integrase
MHSIHSEETKRTYTKYLKFFLKFCNFNEFEQLLEMPDVDKYDCISDFLIYLKEERKISHASIKTNYAAIKKFFKVNNVILQWDQLTRFTGRGQNGKAIEDRTYTKDEIVKLLDHADLRMKVVVLTLLSSGMRIGGLAELKVKDLEYIEKYRFYKITVYSYDLSEKYITFCTPECSSIINKYLEYRKQIGDTIKPDSPLIYRKITRIDGTTKKGVLVTNLFDEHISSNSLQQSVTRLQRKSMIVSIQKEKDHSKKSRIRKEMMRCHAFRKIFDTTCIENNVNHYVKEKLLGHKTKLGLDVNYFRPTETHLLNEYLKVINDLTINDENRLSKQVQELKEKNEDKDYVIKGKLQEKDQEINDLKRSMEFLTNRFNAFLLSQPGNNILYDDNGQSGKRIKGIEMDSSKLNNKAVGTIIPSSNSSVNKKKV